jgi:catechol 2,3-dioxygenase-like lactoylglutathione lyase family enzyme
MFAYITVGSTDFSASVRFYDATLATLGYARLFDYSESGWIGYGPKTNKESPTLWLCQNPYNGQPAVLGNGLMFGLSAPSTEVVDLFFKTALATGGTSEGEPGIREAYGPNAYLAYVRDPMGNKISVLFGSF